MITPQQLEGLTKKKMGDENISEKAQHDLEEKMERVLEHPGTSYNKSLQYNNLLEKYLSLLKKRSSQESEVFLKLPTDSLEKKGTNDEGYIRVEEEENPRDSIEDDILHNIGARNRKNAAFILQKLRNSDLLRWNQSGEIIVQDKTIKGSHIFDLMKTLSNRRFHARAIPRGWDDFLKTISKLNIPLTTIANTQAREQLRQRPIDPPSDPNPKIRRSKRKRGRKSSLSTSLLDMDYNTPTSKLSNSVKQSYSPSKDEWRLSTPIPSEWLEFRR